MKTGYLFLGVPAMEHELLETSAHDQGKPLAERELRRIAIRKLREARAKRRQLDRLTGKRNPDRMIFFAILLAGVAIGVWAVCSLGILVSAMTEGSWTKVGDCQVNGLVEVCS